MGTHRTRIVWRGWVPVQDLIFFVEKIFHPAFRQSQCRLGRRASRLARPLEGRSEIMRTRLRVFNLRLPCFRLGVWT
jgi:hypothetical protein